VDSPSSIDTEGHADWLAMASRTAHVAVGVSSFPSGVIVEVNEAFCRLFQRPRDQIVGRTAVDLGLWVDAQQRLVEGAQQPNGIAGFEARYRNSLGETGDLEISARVIVRHGERFVIDFLTEATTQREVVEGLRVAQSRLGVVLRASDMLVFRQDAALRYTWVANPALGATESELIGRTDEDIMGAEAAAPLVAVKRRVLATACAERRDVWVAHNGQLGCFDLVVEPERDAAGRVVGIVCAAQDITRRMAASSTPPGTAVRTIQGMSSLIGREALTTRQAERLQRIDDAAGRLRGPPDPTPARERLRKEHAGKRVVVAEHNPVMRLMVAALLEEAGLQPIVAVSGVEAFSFTMQSTPALLLLDMELPQNGGVAAARALRTMAPPALPIVAMLSALSAPVGAALALDADLDDVLDKPVAAARLYERVLAWLSAGT
jgi:CheY-like chemotaxis protein/PAS domain-containing protein